MVEPDAPRDASAAVDRGGGLPAGVSDQPAVSIGSVEYLRHRLTAEEAEHFATQGWLLIENALPAEQHWLLQELVTGMHDAKMAKGRLPHETIVQAAFSPANSLQDHEATMHLLKNERVLPKVVDILGANIKCYHSHWNYTPGRNEPEPDYSDLPTLGFHQDSHRVNVEMGHEQPGGPRARLSLKCAYFLTDCSCSGRANTWVVPGSHLLDTLPSVPGGRGQPPGAVPVLAPANSCLVFDRRLWHTASVNWSSDPRLVCFVGYAPRWMKARDAMWVEPSIERTSCPVVKQLLGATTTMAGLYGGNRHDMPLRYWLHSIGADTGLGMNLKIADDWGARGMGDAPSGGLDGDRGHATFPRCPERIDLPLGPEVGSYSFPALAAAAEPHAGNSAQQQLQLQPAEEIELDADQYIANRLTQLEREQFDREGYLIIEDALPAAHHTALLEAVDEARAESIATRQNHEAEMTHAAAFSPVNNLQNHRAVVRTLTNERILPKVIDLLGFNICCYHYHVNVTPPALGEASALGMDGATVPDAIDISNNVKTFRFHQDSGQPIDMEEEDYSADREPPQFSLKCAYVLTDCDSPGMANTWIIPRRHKFDNFEAPVDGFGQPKGAIPVCCKANSCLIFDRRLFHTPTPNWSPTTRKVCFVGYGFRWIQPKDGMYVEPAMAAATCPVLKQMLGYTSSNAGLYQPNSADTPIRPWLHSIGIDEPLGPAARRPGFGELDGLLPLPTTVRELEAQGLFEGDAGHSTEPRAGAEMFRRALSNGQDGQTMKERLDAEERASRTAANRPATNIAKM